MGNQIDSARFTASNAKDSVFRTVSSGIDTTQYYLYRTVSLPLRIFGETSEALIENNMFAEFKPEQIIKLKSIFTQIDTNQDNSLSREEFKNFLENSQGLKITAEGIENLVCFSFI